MRICRFFFVSAVALSVSSCAQFFKKEKTYRAIGSRELNGAQVTSAVKPMGGKSGLSVSAMVYSAGTGETDGPFLWRIEAIGEKGIHQSLIVHELTVRTAKTGRAEPYPEKWLGIIAPFEPMKGEENAGKVFAKYQLPGKLEVFPEEDGEITLVAELTIRSVTGNRRGEVAFRMEPTIERETETLFLPREIAKSLGGEDPTEWDWTAPSGSQLDDDFWGDRSYY
jgi:hypothetical protein